MRSAIHFLGGSLMVYVLMAACSAGTKSKSGPGQQMATGGSTTSQGAAAAVGTTAGAPVSGSNGDPGSGGIIGEIMDPVPDADAETSGTRLRARYYVGEDGSRQFVGWRDNVRNEDCAFWKGTSGVLRCTPFFGTGPATYFADSACTQPVTITAKASGSACGITAPAAQYVYLSDACGANRQRYTVASQPTVGSVFIKAGDACTDVTAAYQSTYDIFTLTAPEPAPDSAFVAASEQVE